MRGAGCRHHCCCGPGVPRQHGVGCIGRVPVGCRRQGKNVPAGRLQALRRASGLGVHRGLVLPGLRARRSCLLRVRRGGGRMPAVQRMAREQCHAPVLRHAWPRGQLAAHPALADAVRPTSGCQERAPAGDGRHAAEHWGALRARRGVHAKPRQACSHGAPLPQRLRQLRLLRALAQQLHEWTSARRNQGAPGCVCVCGGGAAPPLRVAASLPARRCAPPRFTVRA